MISALVTLYMSLEDKESVVKTLSEAIQWYKKNKPQSPDLLTLYRENARYLIVFGKTKEAIALLEELRKANPRNPKVIAQLISAYSQIDPKKANEMMKELPSIETEIASVDVEALEESNWSLGAKYVKKTVKAEASPAPGALDKDKKKPKKKRRKILPKNYDPSVDPDPERWLPRWQRSTFKKKKDKRAAQSVGRGTQGAVGPEAEITSKPSPKPGSSNLPNSPQEGPRQQKPRGKGNKKSKGRR
jgi:signal recognition particle subunit SRP72